jgi:hypothetical protein
MFRNPRTFSSPRSLPVEDVASVTLAREVMPHLIVSKSDIHPREGRSSGLTSATSPTIEVRLASRAAGATGWTGSFYATSKRPAAPMPPPTHMVTTTYFTPRRFPSMRAWPTIRAPLMP